MSVHTILTGRRRRLAAAAAAADDDARYFRQVGAAAHAMSTAELAEPRPAPRVVDFAGTAPARRPAAAVRFDSILSWAAVPGIRDAVHAGMAPPAIEEPLEDEPAPQSFEPLRRQLAAIGRWLAAQFRPLPADAEDEDGPVLSPNARWYTRAAEITAAQQGARLPAATARLEHVPAPEIPGLTHAVAWTSPAGLDWSVQTRESARLVLDAAASTEAAHPDDFIAWLREEFAGTRALCEAAVADHAQHALASNTKIIDAACEVMDRQLDELNALTLPGFTGTQTTSTTAGVFA